MSRDWIDYFRSQEEANTGICLDHRAANGLPTDPKTADEIDCFTECPAYATCPLTIAQADAERSMTP
jgi:hypothetical protein